MQLGFIATGRTTVAGWTSAARLAEKQTLTVGAGALLGRLSALLPLLLMPQAVAFPHFFEIALAVSLQLLAFRF